LEELTRHIETKGIPRPVVSFTQNPDAGVPVPHVAFSFSDDFHPSGVRAKRYTVHMAYLPHPSNPSFDLALAIDELDSHLPLYLWRHEHRRQNDHRRVVESHYVRVQRGLTRPEPLDSIPLVLQARFLSFLRDFFAHPKALRDPELGAGSSMHSEALEKARREIIDWLERSPG